jgi:tRNA (guanosine-2'-O-)-methyltransferase
VTSEAGEGAPGASPAEIIARLGAHVSPGRLARLRAVAARRTRHLSALCERFADLHNVAACMRTAEALGLQELHVVMDADATPEAERRPPRDPIVARSVSLASERWIDRSDHASSEAALAALRQRGYRIVVSAAAGELPETPLAALPLDRPLALVLGNERDGILAATTAQADARVAIAMRGFVQSLNVSVAFAIVMARLRERLEAELDVSAWALGAAEQEALVARWLLAHVPHAEAICRLRPRGDGP